MTMAQRLLRWYDRHRRDLPWRAPPGRQADPYHVLVSEAMLQQTQVASVIPYFHRFLHAFPTLFALAGADEQAVLRLWQGLGYYSRARHLRAAARMVVGEFGGAIPTTLEKLLRLPGVGRYTAGAIASIAFGRRAPILDGNVARVICRLDRIESDPKQRQMQIELWRRAQALLPPRRVGDFNQALMDLGATICTPRNPRCRLCPLNRECKAFAAGVQNSIPLRRAKKTPPLNRRWTICIAHRDRFLIEQRPPRGRWAGMWQFVTIEPSGRKPGAKLVHRVTSLRAGGLSRIGRISHVLSHRRYEFEVYRCEVARRGSINGRKWVRIAELDAFPLPRPQLKIAQMLRAAF